MKLTMLLLLGFLSACRPALEIVYDHSFELRAARELDAIGDSVGARYYLKRALTDTAARDEAYRFLGRMSARKEGSLDCVAAKRADLAINQYPRVRHKNLFQLAVCLEGAGENTKALATYDLSESAGSKQPQLYVRRAFLKERLADKAGAKRDLERALELNAEYLPAELGYGLFLIRNGEYVGLGKVTDLLHYRKPFYAEILTDAEKHRTGLVKDTQAKAGGL